MINEWNRERLSEIEIIALFTDAMCDEGIGPAPYETIRATGKLERYDVAGDKRKSGNGWYTLHADRFPNGTFGCNKRYGNEHSFTWKPEHQSAPMSADERRELERDMKARQAARDEKTREQREAKAELAASIWNDAKPSDGSHGYLTGKGINASGTRIGDFPVFDKDTGEILRTYRGALLIQIRDFDKRTHSLQAIPARPGEDGKFSKLYLTGGAKRGNFFPIGQPKKNPSDQLVFIVCEGFATGASIHEATGQAVVVAFDSANLQPVCEAIRAKFPDAVILVAADNDRWTVTPINNPGVHHAHKAAHAVNGLVAIPDFIDLDGRPTDANDLHALQGLDAVEALISAALDQRAQAVQEQVANYDDVPPPAPDQERSSKREKGGEKAQAAVAELNEKHAVVIVGDKTVVMMERQSARRGHGTEVLFMSVESFKLFYLNQSVWVEIIDKDGKDKSKFVPVANWWLQSPDRRQYEGITFKPDGNEPRRYYNMWHGHAVEPLPPGIFRNAMKCRRLLRHMKYNACRGNREHFHYLLAWMADLVQDPAEKKGVALVMRGRKGCGKSKIAEILASLFGGHAIKIAQMKHLLGNFNRHLANKMLAVAEESFWAGNKADDGPLKDMVTSDTVMLEAKGIDAVEMESYVRILMITNNAWVVPASDDERRYFVLDVGDAHLQDNDYFAAIDEQMNRNSNEGRRALLSLLMSFDLSKVNLRRVPETDALREQRALSMESHDQFIHDALVSGYIGEIDWEIPRPITKKDLHDAYLVSMKKRGKSHPMDLARFCSHFSKRIDVTTERPRAKPWEKRERVFNLPRREEAAKQFGRAMRIDMSHVLEGSDSPIHD